MFRKSVYNLTELLCPKHMYIDNTTAAANKCLTGQVPGRHRFKRKETDPVGLLKYLNIDVHFTSPNHEVASPGSKPIERAFGIGGLHSTMRELPALMGRGTRAKPIPYSEFLALLPEAIAEHNARKGRRGGVCNGRSFDEVFADGLGSGTPLYKASPQLRRMLLWDQESCTVSKQGTVTLNAGRGDGRHRYYADFLVHLAGDQVAVLFNPENLSEQVHIYSLTGKLLGTADWLRARAFNDKAAGREHARLKTQHAKLTKQAAQKATRISDLEFKQLNVGVPAGKIPDPARSVTQLAPPELQTMLANKPVSSERLRSFEENLRRNIAAMA